MNECNIKKHWKTDGAYLYTCKKCYNTEDKRKKPYPDGSWCHCDCGHNTLTCTICWKPVKIINGMYWYIPLEREEVSVNSSQP